MANGLDENQRRAFEQQLPYYRAQQAKARAYVQRWERATGMTMAEYFALPIDESLAVATAAAKKIRAGQVI